jgi:hypothetical protein
MENALVAITLFSIAVAIAASIVAWRVMREERRRSEARIAALAAEIRGESNNEPALREGAPPALVADMFAAGPLPSAYPRTAALVGAGAFVVGVLIALVVVVGGDSSEPSVAQEEPVVADATELQLLSLEHERRDDQLIVRGTLNNLPAQPEADLPTVVVLLFRSDGGLVTKASATIEPDPLTPDPDGTFAVIVPDASEIGRYRVSFRKYDQVVPHVDRRLSQ